MARTLDIAPLRSLVAVSDCGGFQRAADALHLSQAAISQHVRRLEGAVGRPLVERQGRGSRFTDDGELLLAQARAILALHDEALHGFGVDAEQTVVIGSTEHAAAQLLPYLSAQLERSLPATRVRLRIDRGTRLREGLASGRIDLALLIGSSDDARATPVGDLVLTWYAAPGWSRPAHGAPLPLAAFDDPCALRTRALETLAAQGVPAQITAEAGHLAGVHAAVAAGVGVALMATLGQTPSGLVPRADLPPAAPLPLAIWSRVGLAEETTMHAANALRRLLSTASVASGADLALAEGA